MKGFAIIAFALFCVTSTLGQSNIAKLNNKYDANEKEFYENFRTKEADLWNFRRTNQAKGKAVLAKLQTNLKAKKASKCTLAVRSNMADVENRFNFLVKEITGYYTPRKDAIFRDAQSGFKADRDVANGLGRKYRACGDETCKAAVNKEIDAKVAEPANRQGVAETDDFIMRTRKYSGVATDYFLMRVEFLEKDLEKCPA